MVKIVRGGGENASEQLLKLISDECFMRLWNYPNPFRLQRVGGATSGDGKELCDHLVVFGNNVIIFSDKAGEPSPDTELSVGWPRYFRKVIKKGADSLWGAERWLMNHPDLIFADKSCTVPLPVEIPPKSEITVFRVLVAPGAENECRNLHGSPHFVLSPETRGDDHVNFQGSVCPAYRVGDIDPKEPFIHVLTRESLAFIMKNLDTTSEFIDFLTEREKSIRSLCGTSGLTDRHLVAAYLQTVLDGKRALPKTIEGYQRLEFPKLTFFASREFQAKRQEDSVRVWDEVLNILIESVMSGSFMDHSGRQQELQELQDLAEPLRVMASESRIVRRSLGKGLLEQLSIARSISDGRHARVLRADVEGDGEVYISLLFSTGRPLSPEEYALYQKDRAAILQLYCEIYLQDNPHIARVVGIAREMPGDFGCSYSMVYCERGPFSLERNEELRALREEFRILIHDRIVESHHVEHEFPPLDDAGNKFDQVVNIGDHMICISNSEDSLRTRKKFSGKKRRRRLFRP